MTNIFIIFLPQCWRLKTCSRPFYYFIKMTIQQDLAIFSSWHLLFLNVPHSPFQKTVTWNLDITCLRVIGAGCWIEKNLELSPQSSKLFKRFLNIIFHVYIYQFAKFGNLMSCGSKDIFKNTTYLLHQYSSWRHRFGKLGNG